MKKAIIAGLAGALVLPAVAAADTSVNLWGEFRGSAAFTDGPHALGSDNNVSWTNNNSRIGLDIALNQGAVQGFTWLEYGFDNEESGTGFTARQVFAGIRTNAAEISYGTRQSAYAWAGERVDPFYDTVAGVTKFDSSYGFSSLTDTFDGDQLAFYGNVNGFAVNAAVFFEDSTGSDDTGVAFGVGYDRGPLNLELQALLPGDNGASIEQGDEGNFKTALRLSGGYKSKMADFGFSVESIEPQSGDAATYANVSAGFAAGNGKVAFAVGYQDKNAQLEGVGGSVGYWWNMLENTDLHALVSYTSIDSDVSDDDVVVVGLGVKHSFSARIK